MIQSREGLVALVERLRGAETLGLDVEGDGLYRYRSRLCTMQIGDADSVAVVDTLAIEDLSPLEPILGEDGPRKVVHDVSFDRKMLATRDLGLARVFDTSVAARFLGEPATGLAALLEARFEVKLDKKYQKADWGERPLDDARLAYLVADVHHLPALAAQLEEAAREHDILEEIADETRYAMARSLMPEAEWAPWTRVKGGRDLGPDARAILHALAEAREDEAYAEDVPPFRVASNAVLFEAARRRPRTLRDLRRVRGLRRIPDEGLERALREAKRDGPPADEPVEAPPPPAVRAERKAREKSVTAWRKAEAEARGVDVQAVLPGHCLRDVCKITSPDAASLAAVPGFGDKRASRYTDVLLGLLGDADVAD